MSYLGACFSSCWDSLRNYYTQLVNHYHEFRSRNKCVFTEEELATYESITWLTIPDIRRVYRKFVKIIGEEFQEDNKNPFVWKYIILQTRELCNNPLNDRIAKVFAYSRPYMCFEEYLNMISIFSPDAPLKVKAEYAFKIYDFNEDGLLCKDDIKELLDRLRGTNVMKNWVRDEVANMILSEADLDGDNYLNFSEFEHSLSKNPDFVSSFKLKI